VKEEKSGGEEIVTQKKKSNWEGSLTEKKFGEEGGS
jgi:hypothetical protein